MPSTVALAANNFFNGANYPFMLHNILAHGAGKLVEKPAKPGDKGKKSGGFSTLSESASVRMLAMAVLLSVLATRPNVTSGKFSKEDVANKKVNFLFFGNFHKMQLRSALLC